MRLLVDHFFFRFYRFIFYQFGPAGNESDNTFSISIKDVTSDLVWKISKNRRNHVYQFTEVLFSL